VDKWGVAPSLREPPPFGRYTTSKNTPTAIWNSILICWYRLMFDNQAIGLKIALKSIFRA